MNQTTVAAPSQAPKPRRYKKPDLGTDRSKAYNKIHNTEIANNHMLDRYLRNKEELEKMEGKRGR